MSFEVPSLCAALSSWVPSWDTLSTWPLLVSAPPPQCKDEPGPPGEPPLHSSLDALSWQEVAVFPELTLFPTSDGHCPVLADAQCQKTCFIVLTVSLVVSDRGEIHSL